jgi:hypothetical protein
MDRAIDRLRSAVSMEATERVVTLPDGSPFSFWMTPLTLAERQRAQKAAKGDDTDFVLQLLVSKARDENGQPLFVPAEIVELRNALAAKTVEALLVAMAEDDSDAEPLDPKSSAPSLKKTRS